ncbi:MAG: sugar ABC transporter permease [Chloroflexi bacterium]|nr:sugar ABC transporter permease [Chloroflexota bacterium]
MDGLSARGPNPVKTVSFFGRLNPFRIFSRNRDGLSGSRDSRFAAALLSPALILIVLLVVVPMIFALYLSLHKVDMVAGAFKLVPVGLGNYTRLLSDTRFLPTIERTLWFTSLRLAISLSVGLGLALLLNEATTAARILNRLFLIPWALSFVVNGLMWKWMYNGDYGIVNYIMLHLGLIDSYKSWLGVTSTALNAITITDAWKAIPFVALVLLSGLKSIPEEVYESAKVDGAGVFQRFWHITLPALRPVLLVTLVMQTMWSIMAFASIWPVTQGGPADSTMLLNIYAYQQSFMYLNLGYGSALAYVITLIILMLTLAYMAVLRMDE